MQVTLHTRSYIPANYQQRPGNTHWEVTAVDAQGTLLDGVTILGTSKQKQAEKFMQNLCTERGWEVIA